MIGYYTPGKAGTERKKMRFFDLPLECFPFTLELFDVEQPALILWSTTVTGPGALSIPGFAGQGKTIGTRAVFADGEVQEWTP